MQTLLPLFQEDISLITDELGYQQREGRIYYFHAGLPIFHHAVADHQSFRMIISQFYLNGLCKQVDLVRAFGVTPISVKRAVKQYEDRGPASFYQRPAPPHQPRQLVPAVVAEAETLLAEGLSRGEVAQRLGLKKDTLRKGIESGRVRELKKN
jgi:transposase